MLTRRVTQRKFLLRPDKESVEIYNYCLAEAATRFDVQLYGWIAMGNHEHVIARDKHANLPEFMAHFRKMLAKAMNRHRGRAENFWSSQQANVVQLLEPEDTFAKLIYLLANPVAGHLVDRASDWPGAASLQQNLSGRAVVVNRPRGFFRSEGPMPPQVVLRVERIPASSTSPKRSGQEKILAAVQVEDARAPGARGDEADCPRA